jgi:hypothetical protein
MFKQKLEKIDFNYLTWHNMQRVYDRFNGFGDFNRRDSLDSSDRDSFSSKSGATEAQQYQRRQQLNEQYRMLFNSMVEIIDVISE